MERSHEELMRAYQEGDQEAMQILFQQNKVRILNFCFGLLGNRADAEEVAGDVFLAVVKNKHAFDPERTFSTWIYTIARNQCVSRLRRRRLTTSLWFTVPGSDQAESWDVPDSGELSRDSAVRAEMAREVRAAIAKLSFEQKEAIVLRQYHGFTYAQISQVLGCSLEKVKILIFRAKERLRVELASYIREGQS